MRSTSIEMVCWTIGLLVGSSTSPGAMTRKARSPISSRTRRSRSTRRSKPPLEKVPGTVVEAELEKKHGKTVWEVEVLGADGKVTEVHIDAATGTVIDTEAKKDKHEDKKKKK